MENTMIEIESTISVLNTILQNITFRTLYQINETVVITLTDGEFVVKSNLLLIYEKEESPVLNDRFYILLSVIALVLILWILSTIGKMCRLCCCCCCRSTRKGKNTVFYPYDKKQEIELTSTKQIEDSQQSFPHSAKKKRNLPPPLPHHPPPPLPNELNYLPGNNNNHRIITKKSRRPSD